LDANLLFTAALLHDLGKLALNTALHQRYDEIVATIEATGRSFLEVEQELLGTDHARVGGRLLERWNFPENLREGIRFHHDPTRAGAHQRLAAGILLADMLAHLAGYGVGHFAFAVRAHPEILPILNLGQQDIERLIASTQTAVSEFELLK
jgi:HD-like signal output (HDOD) protein